MTNRILLLAAVLAASFMTVPVTSAAESPRGERHLFVDDQGIARLENLRRTMHVPVKRGAVITPERPWEMSLQTRSAPAWDPREKIFKLWVITSTPAEGVGGMSYLESKDGLVWTRPILRQWDYQGSRENNFVSPEPGLAWPANAMENVVLDPDDRDPSRRYKGFLEAFARQPIASPDGIHWKRLDVPKLPSQDESNLSYDRQARLFIATLKTGGPFGRSHGIWTSRDFLRWTNTKVVFHADAEDQRLAQQNIRTRLADPKLQQPVYNNPADYNADIYNLGIFRYEGVYLGMPAVYHATGRIPEGNTDGFHLIQLIASRDLVTWTRLGDRKTFIGPSPVGDGVFDLMQLLPPSGPVAHGEELWFYYTGLKYRARPKNADLKSGGICLAVLRRDGFLSLDAGSEPGTLLTKPLVVNGTRMYVNVAAGQGSLVVTALDDQGKVVAVSDPVVGDQTRARVHWKSGDLATLGGKTASFRFVLRRGEFYSFWLDE